MKLQRAYWDGNRWHEAGENVPEGHLDLAIQQGAIDAPAKPVEPGDDKGDQNPARPDGDVVKDKAAKDPAAK